MRVFFLCVALASLTLVNSEVERVATKRVQVPTTWFAANDQMPTPRSDLSATAVGNKIYIIGGCASAYQGETAGCLNVTDVIETFTPTPNTATPIGTFATLATMLRPRFRHSAAAIGTKIYVLGGRDVNDNIIPNIDIYDTVADSWSTDGVLYFNVSDHGSFVVGSTIYLVGGYDQNYDSLNLVYAYDTTTKTWTQKANLTHDRGDISVDYLNGFAYAVGGYSMNDWCAPLAIVERYDPVANAWTDVAPMKYPGGDKASATLGGEFIVLGGEQKDTPINCTYSVPIYNVESYDPPRNTWFQEEALIVPKFRFDAEPLNGSVYVFGGQLTLTSGDYDVSSSYEVLIDLTANPQSSSSSRDAALAVTIAIGSVLVIGIMNA